MPDRKRPPEKRGGNWASCRFKRQVPAGCRLPHSPSPSTDRPGRLSRQGGSHRGCCCGRCQTLFPWPRQTTSPGGTPGAPPTTTCASGKPSAPGRPPRLPGACLMRPQGRLHMPGTSPSHAGACRPPRAWLTPVTRGRHARPPPCC